MANINANIMKCGIANRINWKILSERHKERESVTAGRDLSANASPLNGWTAWANNDGKCCALYISLPSISPRVSNYKHPFALEHENFSPVPNTDHVPSIFLRFGKITWSKQRDEKKTLKACKDTIWMFPIGSGSSWNTKKNSSSSRENYSNNAHTTTETMKCIAMRIEEKSSINRSCTNALPCPNIKLNTISHRRTGKNLKQTLPAFPTIKLFINRIR